MGEVGVAVGFEKMRDKAGKMDGQLVGKVLGDPRWSGSTPLIGAITSGQAVIVKYLIERGARVDAKTKLGWTPLMVAEGVFFGNAKKEYPEAAALIRAALAKR